jgi:hypothetical protein
VRNLNERNITQAVIARHDRAANARLREVMTAIVRHLHEFARETRLTEAEWLAGIEFLTAAGHITDESRQEFILLSDVLGLSMLVVAQNHAKPSGCTEATVFGPCADAIEVWQADADGYYDVQYKEGVSYFRTVVAESYPIPHDGRHGARWHGQPGSFLPCIGVVHPLSDRNCESSCSDAGEPAGGHVYEGADACAHRDSARGARSVSGFSGLSRACARSDAGFAEKVAVVTNGTPSPHLADSRCGR